MPTVKFSSFICQTLDDIFSPEVKVCIAYTFT